jgi:hypothetical protein
MWEPSRPVRGIAFFFKCRRLWWTEYAVIVKWKNGYRILVGKHPGKQPLMRLRIARFR